MLKKLFMLLFVSLLVVAQVAEKAPVLKNMGNNVVNKEAIWDLQINQVVGAGGPIKVNGNAGIAYLNGKYYISKWSSAKIYVLNSNFVLEDSMSFSSLTTGFRALTTDGTYLYATTATTNIYKIDITTKTITQTLTGAAVSARFCTYDPTADNGNGGFWIGNYSTNIVLVKKDAINTKLYEITSTSHGLTGMYGAAIDVTSPGGPYLYIANQASAAQQIVKFKALTGEKLETYNVMDNFGSTNPTAVMGGLFIQKDLVTQNVTTLLGILQGTPDILFGYIINEPIVGPGYATNFNPANNAVNVPVNVQLKWSNPSGTTKIAVYFSTNKDYVTARYAQALVKSNVLDSSYTPSQNLNYNTTYYWRVLTINANNDTTLGPVLKFKTEFGVVTDFPYFQGFEDPVFPPDGWLNPQGYWGIGKAGSSGTGVKSGLQCARVAYNHATNPAELISPKFQIPQYGQFKITFWWKDNDIPTSIAGHDTTYFEVSTDNGQTWTVKGFLAATSTMTNYELFTLNLNEYKGKTVIFKWRDVTNKSFSAYGTGLDDVKIEEVLPTPSSVIYVSPLDKDTNQTKNVALIWRSGMGATETGFKVYLSTDSAKVANNDATALIKDTVLAQAPTANQDFIVYTTNLNWNTKYYWKVDAYNQQGTTSGTIRRFKTINDPTILTFPYVEDFENGVLPYGWTKSFNSNWKVAKQGSSIPAYSGQYALAIKYNGTSNSTVVSPEIQLPANKDMRMSFAWINNDFTLSTSENRKIAKFDVITNNQERLVKSKSFEKVEIAGHDTTFFEISSDNGITWNVEAFNSPDAKQTNWDEVSLDLTQYKGKNIYFRFRFKNDGSFSAYGAGVDLIKIEEIPTGKPWPVVILEPQNGATNLNKDVIIKWKRANGPLETSYKLYFGQDSTNAQLHKTYQAAKEVTDTLKNLEYGKSYYWAVEALNDSGTAKTKFYKFTIMDDPTIKVFPYTENFDSTPANSVPNGWIFVDANNDGKTLFVYTTNGWAYSQPNVLAQQGSAVGMNDWAILPPLQLEANKTYRFKIQYTVGDSTEYEKFEVKWGNNSAPASLTNTIIPTITTKSWDWVEASGTFTPTQNGTYYIGIHTQSDPNSSAIIFDDVVVELALDKDLMVEKILQPGTSVPNDGVIPVVRVKNIGIQNAANFEVKLSIGTNYNETKQVQLLGVGTSIDIPFPKWTPTQVGNYIVKAIVNWNDDQYKNNDTIVKVVKVLPFSIAFNFSWADEGLVSLYGAEFANGKFYASVWNSTTGKIYVFNKDKELVDSMNLQGYSGQSGIRDLAWDGQFLYGGNNATTIYKIDPVQKAVVSSFSFTGTGNVRGIAYNAKQDAFYVGGFNPGATNILLVNRNGQIIKSIPNTLGTYSLAYDTITPGGPFLWVATNRVYTGNTALDYKLMKLDPNTGAILDSIDIVDIATGTTPGGLFITHEFFNDGSMVLGGLSQGGNFWGLRFKDYIVGNENTNVRPVKFYVEQNYPNPFNPATNIRFALSVDAKVTLKVYNTLGQEVVTLFDGQLSAGYHTKVFNANTLSTGIYIYRIDAIGINGQKFSETKKMMLIK